MFAQKEINANKVTTNTKKISTNTIQVLGNTTNINSRSLSQTSTMSIHQVRETPIDSITNSVINTYYGDTHSGGTYTSVIGNSNSNTSNSNTAVNCPMMHVQVNIPFLQSCVSSSAQIDFCNHGTASALGSFVDVELPAQLLLDSADIPFTVVGTNLYRFQLGTVPVLFCDQFEIYFTTDCDSTLIGMEHCIHAHIYPDTLCNSVQSTPLITIDASCVAGKTTFTLHNHGTAVTMDQHMQLIVIDDHLIVGGSPYVYWDDTLELESGASLGRGFTPSSSGQNDYKLDLTDKQGNLLVSSTVHDCYVGSPNVYINTFHTHQSINTFGNGGILPSMSTGCAINGNSTTQTSSSFGPPATSSRPPNDNTSPSIEFVEEEETNVQVFPNPFSEYATVKIDGPITKRFTFRLYDTMGKMVRLLEINGQDEFQIERNDLLSGMYLYQIDAKGKSIHSGKLIVK